MTACRCGDGRTGLRWYRRDVTSVGDVVAFLERRYPPAWAESWDRVGLVLGEPSAPVTTVLLVVDCVPETVDEAVAVGADLIVAHHPLLLRGVSSVAPRSVEIALYFSTLNCIRMLWNSASASSKTRARQSAPARPAGLSRSDSASAIAVSAPMRFDSRSLSIAPASAAVSASSRRRV